MKEQSVLLPKHCTVSIFCFLAVMMLIGSFFDASISKAVYDPTSGFGIFFAAYGEYPAALSFVAAGTLLCLARNREKRWIAVLQCLGGAWLCLSGICMAAILPTLYLKQQFLIILCIGVLCSAAVAFLMVTLCKHADRKTILRVAVMICVTIFAEIVIVNLIKIPWGRPRMRLVAVDPRACFLPWWQAGSALKDSLVATGVAAEEFKSFPSGHTANAATLMLLGLLPLLNQKLAGKKVLLVSVGFAWACLVAFSRIIMGAHYLTDTVVGFAVSLTVMLIFSNVILKERAETRSAVTLSTHNKSTLETQKEGTAT